MSTWMVTGSTGQLGAELVALLEAEGERVVPLGGASSTCPTRARCATWWPG
ncbi:hypothetical protein [Nonomuraea recticatena]|uniref:hypothetical protein n=1 Tax=Nonomuraea recticatena TaxID=46178 RepID=UPI00361B5229